MFACSLFFRALPAETGSAARPLRPQREELVPRAERRPAGHPEAAAAGQLVRPQTNNERSVSTEPTNTDTASCSVVNPHTQEGSHIPQRINLLTSPQNSFYCF